MSTKSKIFALFGVLAIVLVTAAFFYKLNLENNTKVSKANLHQAEEKTEEEEGKYFGAIVPHHDVAAGIAETVFKKIDKEQKPKTIALIAPDHLDRTHGEIATTASDTLLGLSVNTKLTEELLSAGYLEDFESISSDHSILFPLSVIKKYWPDANIVPVLVTPRADRQEMDRLTDNLDKILPENSLVVGSVDFSHFLNPRATNFHDAHSLAVFKAMDEEAIEDIEVDSWQSLYTVRKLGIARSADIVEAQVHSNTSEITGKYLEENTGYFGLVIEKGASKEQERAVTLLGVGDMLLARDVERLMNTGGADYPFERISRFFRGVDINLGNLEGPITEDYFPVPAYTYRFSFKPEAADILKNRGFDVLNIANNHAFDAGGDSPTGTARYLREAGISPVGTFKNAGNYVYKKNIGGRDMGIVGTTIFSGSPDTEELIKIIKDTDEEVDFLVVTIHWGNEYALQANRHQKGLAERLIGAGADTILGHHPHVVQNIELVSGKPVFYSLGNFLFDQYTNTETNRGLAVGIEVGAEDVNYYLFPLSLNAAQPSLMERGKAEPFLKSISERSGSVIRDDIINGIIKVEL